VPQESQRALETMLDAGQLRRAHMSTVSELLDCFSCLLSGKGCIDMDQHGRTSAEECDTLGEESWPLMALIEDTIEDGGVEGDGEEFYLPIGAGVPSFLGLMHRPGLAPCMYPISGMPDNPTSYCALHVLSMFKSGSCFASGK
jgi:hypothetical protein